MDIWRVPVLKIGGGYDKQGDAIAEDAILRFNGTVCLVKDFGRNLAKSIGTAQLKLVGDTMYADLYLLNDEFPYELTTPAVGGKVLKSITDFKTGKRTITEMQIDVVSLSVGANADPRIKKVGELGVI